MSAWQFVGAWFVVLGLSGCFVDAGKTSASGSGDAETDATASTAEPTTADSGGPPGDTTSGEMTGEGTQTDPFDDDDGDVTTGDQCRGAGEACEEVECCGCLVCLGGVCLPNNDACGGECRSCNAKGICNLADIGESCEASSGEDCTSMVWGEKDGTCYAFDVATGACDATGQCVGSACVEQGEEILSCPECMLAENACVAGTNVQFIDVTSFCATSGATAKCEGYDCNGDDMVYKSCGADGVCQENVESCGAYTCQGGACATDCASDSDCSGTADCVEGVCM